MAAQTNKHELKDLSGRSLPGLESGRIEPEVPTRRALAEKIHDIAEVAVVALLADAAIVGINQPEAFTNLSSFVSTIPYALLSYFVLFIGVAFMLSQSSAQMPTVFASGMSIDASPDGIEQPTRKEG